MVISYKRAGLDLVLSLASLGDTFEMTIPEHRSVGAVISQIQVDRGIEAALGMSVEVKLIGPAGTVLPHSKTICQALSLELAELEPDDEEGEFYPLSDLRGAQGRWRQLGL